MTASYLRCAPIMWMEAAALVKGCMEALPPLENFMPLGGEVAVGERYGELE